MNLGIDKDVENYTPEELFTILELNEEQATKKDVINKTDTYIQQFKKDKHPDMATFFQDIQFALNDYIDSIETTQNEDNEDNNDVDANNDNTYSYSSATKQTDNWYENQSLKQNDTNQSNKVTERKQKVDVYNNPHLPMKQEQLGVNNNFTVPVAQDTLNPNLENVTKRFICLDSRYRQASGQNGVATDYTLDLSDPLLNAISLRLYSFQIPVGWYNIETYNCCFWIQFYDDIGYPIYFPGTTQNWINISIPPGRYDSTTLVVALNTALNGQFNFSGTAHPIPVEYNSTTSKITMYLDGGVDSSLNLTINDKTRITFFDPNGEMKCASTCSTSLNYKNTFGYLMGYTDPSISVLLNGNLATSLLNLSGPQYLILVIDDYNQNHINNGLIGITEYSNNLKMPSYYNPSMPVSCTAPTASAVQTSQVLQEESTLLTAQKLDITYKPGVTVLPTAPRILTQAQLYSINQITKNNENNTIYKSTAPTTPDTFAIIPIKGNVGFGDVYTDFSGSVQDNKRTYFGPVRIDRLHIKLLDDKGNLLDLHGLDWSITLICENLYQY